MKYRKKPVVIDAVQWTGENHREMFNFLENKPDEYITATGEHFYIDHDKVQGGPIIKTLEGEHRASIGDTDEHAAMRLTAAWNRRAKHMPTVDTVEVVRCRDCVHFGECLVTENDYCSRGERKENY